MNSDLSYKMKRNALWRPAPSPALAGEASAAYGRRSSSKNADAKHRLWWGLRPASAEIAANAVPRPSPAAQQRGDLSPQAGKSKKNSHRALQRVGEVGLLPREPALIVRGAAEMAVGRGPRVDRLVEIEMLADAARRQVHRFGHGLLKLFLGHLAGAMGIDVDRQRPRHADGVSQLQRAAAGEARGDDVLGEIARGIGGRAIHLGRVLAGERAAAMRGRAAIGIDDDLASGQAGIAVGAADVEFAGGIDVPDGLAVDPAFRERLTHIGLDALADLVRRHVLDQMLMRDHDLAHADRLAVLVLHGDLALGIRTQHLLLAGVAGLGDQPQ